MNQNFRTKNIDAVVAVGNGSAIPSAGVNNFTLVIQAAGTPTATVILQGSADGTNWYPISQKDGTAMSLAFTGSADTLAISVSNQAHNMVRARVSAWTAESINAWVIGG